MRSPTWIAPFAMTLTAAFLGAAVGLSAPAALASGHYDPDEAARVAMLPGWREADGTHMAALHVALGDGWKTYWRAPGDAGIPPSIDWSGSRNLASVSYKWPLPEVFEQNGLRTIGYQRELVLPIQITPRDPSAPVTLKARVTLGVCRDVCLPKQSLLKVELPNPGAPDARISRAMGRRPDTAAEAGVSAVRCQVTPSADGLEITAHLTLPRQGGKEVVVMETGNPEIWVSEAQVTRRGPTLTASAELVPPPGTPMVLDRSALRFTVLAEGRGVDVLGCGS
ncbi:protein-disulfide reductase DsbD domain-containing protein [Aliiroseovarius sp.]|uniref:protein-disulfide reductase DsbD domain-containing protein n=1 Tax=Aliiroseovarius sp. TaxID=1872442 RepID=UPI002626C2D9|nr:protein-disulfide reductase DsbD domain-containing protein [Aliiroseovarius sp.]